MNILEVEDMIKGMPDNALMQEAQRPSGQVPQFLVISELQRRGDMRKRFQAQQQQPQATVKDQIVMESMGAGQPQGIMAAQPQQAPQQMPPQQMFSGGVIRLAPGGSTGMPGAYALQGLTERAKEIARELGITVADAMQMLSQKAQMNMPNYSMIAPSGIGELPSMSDIGAAASEYGERARQGISDYADRAAQGVSDAASRVALNAQMNMPNYDMLLGPSGGESQIMSGIAGISDAMSDSYKAEQARINQGIEDGSIYAQSTPSSTSPLAGMLSNLDPGYKERQAAQRKMNSDFNQEVLDRLSSSYENMPSPASAMSDIGSALYQGYRQTPIGKYAAAAQQGISDVYEKDGLGAAIGESGRAGLGALLSLGETALSGYVPAVRGAARLVEGPAQALDQFFTGDTTDPLTLGQIFGGDASSQAVSSTSPQTQGKTDATTQGQTSSAVKPDASSVVSEILSGTDSSTGSLYDNEAFASMLAGEQKPGTVTAPELSRALELAAKNRDASAKDPRLDLSDLIAESKGDALNAALVQLGAGIAGGDLSKGLAAAGATMTDSKKQAKELAMKAKLVEYQAGREDLAREAAESQFVRKLAQDASQFADRLGLSREELELKIALNSDTNEREALRTLLGLYKEANFDEKEAYSKQIMSILSSLGLSPASQGAASASSSDPLGLRNAG